MVIGALCLSLLGGEVVRFLIANDTSSYITTPIAIFCSLAAIAMAVDGLWMFVSNELKDLNDELKKK